MALKYIGSLIAQAREETGETDYSDSADPDEVNGVPQSIPIQAAREAVIHCQNSLYLAAPQVFDTLSEIDGVADQVEYDLPENAYIDAAIASVEYSESGENTDYRMLSLSDFGYRTGGSGAPSRFIPYGDGKFIVDPVCSSAGGKFRIAHGAMLDEPDLRRGKIKTVTPDGSVLNYLTVELEDDDVLDEDTLAADEFLCVNDRRGNVVHYNIGYTYNSSTNVVTFDAGTLIADGVITAGDYVSIGKYSTTHIKLNKIAEPIILAFIRRRFYLGKSSVDVKNEEDNIAAFTKEMVAVYKRRVRTAKKIPFVGRFERLGRL